MLSVDGLLVRKKETKQRYDAKSVSSRNRLFGVLYYPAIKAPQMEIPIPMLLQSSQRRKPSGIRCISASLSTVQSNGFRIDYGLKILNTLQNRNRGIASHHRRELSRGVRFRFLVKRDLVGESRLSVLV